MGCVCSKHLGGTRTRHENISLLASQTFFSDAEVEVLHELFTKLTSCVSSDNLITKEGFQFILTKDTKRRSLSTERMFGLFDMRNDEAIDFGEFVHSLNIFHPNSTQRDKALFAFRLYDTRQTGFIEPEEVKEMIIDVLEESELMLTESIIDSIVSKTFEEADRKKDGKIDLEEWENFVARHPLILKNMTIPFLKDLPRTFPSFLQ
ncbi:PREDICTED: calcineurin B-like protein 5 isoform X1 [Brassica oleracea var. oleracea]|uniref:calcineurin B-like protein 5 isoform X1 n=1 Tax=Brassica oleracea var. oleracea TaxID=109376 RepID=UPI0006A6CED6|nr:PREDICTED: calcineurin B-like protein 5 isoform X1 [Brassica oleracea var. oleracea]